MKLNASVTHHKYKSTLLYKISAKLVGAEVEVGDNVEGFIDGNKELDGWSTCVGVEDGIMEGVSVPDGMAEGILDGYCDTDGLSDGWLVSLLGEDGLLEGISLGTFEGIFDEDGWWDGKYIGVGLLLG